MERLCQAVLLGLMTLHLAYAFASEPQATGCDTFLVSSSVEVPSTLSPPAQAYLRLVRYYLTHAQNKNDKSQVLDQIHASEKFINPFRRVVDDSLAIRLSKAIEKIRLHAEDTNTNWQAHWPQLKIEISKIQNNHAAEQQDGAEKAQATAGIFRPKVLTPINLSDTKIERLSFDQSGLTGSDFLFFAHSGNEAQASDRLLLYSLSQGGLVLIDQFTDKIEIFQRTRSQIAFYTTTVGRKYLATRAMDSRLHIFEIVGGNLNEVGIYPEKLCPGSRMNWYESRDGRLLLSVTSHCDKNIRVLKVSDRGIIEIGKVQTVNGVMAEDPWHEDIKGNIFLSLATGGGGGILVLKLNGDQLVSFPLVYDAMSRGPGSTPSLYSDSAATYLAVSGSYNFGEVALYKITETGLKHLQTLKTGHTALKPQWHRSAEGRVFLAVGNSEDALTGRILLFELIDEKLEMRDLRIMGGRMKGSPSWVLDPNGDSYLAAATDFDTVFGPENKLIIFQLKDHILKEKQSFLPKSGTKLAPIWMMPNQNTGRYVTIVTNDYSTEDIWVRPFRIIENSRPGGGAEAPDE